MKLLRPPWEEERRTREPRSVAIDCLDESEAASAPDRLSAPRRIGGFSALAGKENASAGDANETGLGCV
jgi:hypothetical protein